MARGIYQSQPRPRITTTYSSDASSSSVSSSRDSSETFNEDANGVRFVCLDGLPIENQSPSKHRTRWVQHLSTDVLNPETPYDEANGQESRLGQCGALLIRTELMANPVQDFKTLAANAEESTRHAVKHLFDIEARCLREQFRHQGIWGSDSEDPWVLVFERLYVEPHTRRQGWGSKLVTRVLEEVIRMARRANKAVVVLTMPFAPEREVKARVVSQEQGLRSARAFWRSLGFVRMGETVFFGWTRHVQMTSKRFVEEGELDYDSDVDGRLGYSRMLLR